MIVKLHFSFLSRSLSFSFSRSRRSNPCDVFDVTQFLLLFLCGHLTPISLLIVLHSELIRSMKEEEKEKLKIHNLRYLSYRCVSSRDRTESINECVGNGFFFFSVVYQIKRISLTNTLIYEKKNDLCVERDQHRQIRRINFIRFLLMLL